MDAFRNRLAFVFGLVACFLVLSLAGRAFADDGQVPPLSSMRVEIASQGKKATFQLYDTTAAKAFYDQLPLELNLSSFRQAQWMFYPPERLKVETSEAYHDGRKGELSYYEPWGDVFMLYKDFHAGDEMHRLGVGLSGVDDIEEMSGSAVIRQVKNLTAEDDKTMRITVSADGKSIVFELNDSQAARDLYAQLPLSIKVEDYGGKEKIYYPPKKLNTSNSPLVKGARPGTLSYYAPWGDVVMFYDSFGSAPGLYELGHAVQGEEHIRSLQGTIRIVTGPSR